MSGWGKWTIKRPQERLPYLTTITFNGASAVDANTITSSAHGFRNGDYVKYTDGGDTDCGSYRYV